MQKVNKLKSITMKTIHYFIIIVIVFLISGGCYFEHYESVSGNGKLVKQQREIPEFTGFHVASGIDVIITQSDHIAVYVETDENLQDYIKTEVVNDILKIYTTKTIRNAKEKKVYVGYKKLNLIDISSAGDVSSTNTLVTDKLSIDISSAGDLNLVVEADEIEIDLSSAGDATLKGKTNYLRASLSSAGDLNAFDLEAKKGDVSVSSAGDANVFVTEEANFECSSAGSIDFKGEPRIKNISTSSAGSVNKKQ
jgi:hypothetical protein